MSSRRSLLAAAALAAGLALAVTGCASGQTPGPSDSGSPSSPTSSATTPSGRPTSSSTSVPVSGQCATSDLAGAIGKGTGGAAGSVGVTIVLTNNGSGPCSLQGWPGVSFVGDGNGTQLGKAADFDRSTPHPTVTLQPGGTASAPLRITNAQNYPDSDCSPKKADGFRVYPPGSTESLFIADSDVTACTSTSISLLTVGALVTP